MLSQEQIKSIIESLPHESYRHYTTTTQMYLTTEMANALSSSGKRKPIRILNTVVAAIADKLETETITITDDVSVNDIVNQWLSTNKWDSTQKKIWKSVVRDGKTFVLVSIENNIPRINHIDTFDGRSGATIIYADTNNNIPLYGINLYYESGYTLLDVYYDNRIEKYKYVDDVWQKRIDVSGESWPIDWTDTDGKALGIALVEFSIGESDLANGAVQLQVDINNALLDLIAISRNQGWPQRSIKNATNRTGTLKTATGDNLYSSRGLPINRTINLIPGSVMLLLENEELQQLNAATPDATVIQELYHALYIATTVPMHYFTGTWPSGVSLITAENKLNHKVENHQTELTPAIEQIIRLMIQLSNTFANTKYNTVYTVTTAWYSPEILTEDLKLEKQQSLAQVVTLLKGAGVLSVEQAVRMLHTTWNDTEIATEVSRIQAENSIPSL